MDVRKLDLNLLATLEVLLAERNVTRAAEKLGLSQPTVSAQLARLRDLFDDQLLIPQQRGMTPTVRALELYAPLRQALDGVRDAVTNVGPFDPARADVMIRVGGSDVTHHGMSLPVVLELRTLAPGIRLALRMIDWATIDKDLETGELDIALIVPAAATPTMRSRKLGGSGWSVIARHGHPLINGSLDLDQFCACDHVLTEPGRATFEGQTDRALQTVGRRRNVVLSVAEFLLTVEAVMQSDMIAVVPETITRRLHNRLQVFPVPVAMEPVPLLMVWHERTHAHAAHRWFRDLFARKVSLLGVDGDQA
jgi:DNA-binding transcriptional LysR family regulator